MTEPPETRRLRRLALAAIVVNVAIVISGGAVRLTGSGLGCPDWPTCERGSLTPVASAGSDGWHQAIEFGNRVLTLVVFAVVVACVVAALRTHPRRNGVVRLAVALPVGVLGQGVLGGVTVLTGLHPLIVAAHFLVSLGIIAAAVVLHRRITEGDGPPRLLVHPQLRKAQHLLLLFAAVTLTLGTLVTATGPHAGDAGTPRLGLDPRTVSQIHAESVFLLLGVTIVLIFALRATHAPPAPRRAAAILLGVSLGQGTIGYVQYFTGLPEVLVGMHMLGACLMWIAAVRLWLVSRDRPRHPQPVPAPETLRAVELDPG